MCRFICIVVLLFSSSLHGEVIFTDVSESSGLRDGDMAFQVGNGHGLGTTWVDLNQDGYDDLFLVNGFSSDDTWPGMQMFLNNQNGTFTNISHMIPAVPEVDYMQAIAADYDRDGDIDLYLFTSHEQHSESMIARNPHDGPPNILFKNLFVENGNQLSTPLFADVSVSAGVDDRADPPWGNDYDGHCTNVGGWLDYNRDGYADLYVARWVVNSVDNPANQDALYHNNGDGTFTKLDNNLTGITPDNDPSSWRSALAFASGHLDHDLWPDVYLGHNHILHQDMLYKNLGDGTFTDSLLSMPGLGNDSGAAMGITIGDINRDGNWDMYISDLLFNDHDDDNGNVLYMGKDDGTLADNTATLHGVESTNSWAVIFFDADQDGWEDLFVGTTARANNFFVNDGEGTFSRITSGAEGGGLNNRGGSVSDFDLDGDLDLALVNIGGPLQLFRNDSTDLGNSLSLRLEGVISDPQGIGAIVKIDINGEMQMRQVTGGGLLAHSQNTAMVHFGIGDSSVVNQIEVLWPSGMVDTVTDVAANSQLTIVEGETVTEELRVDDVQPRRLTIGDVTTLTLTGAGFTSDTTLQICNDSVVTVDSLESTSSNELRATVSVAASAEMQDCRLTVTDPDGELATFDSIQLEEAGFRVDSITPDVVSPGQSVDLLIEGTGFTARTRVQLCIGRVRANSIDVLNSVSIVVNADVLRRAPSGSCRVKISKSPRETAELTIDVQR